MFDLVGVYRDRETAGDGPGGAGFESRGGVQPHLDGRLERTHRQGKYRLLVRRYIHESYRNTESVLS